MEENGFCDEGCETELTFWGVFLYSSLHRRGSCAPGDSRVCKTPLSVFKDGSDGEPTRSPATLGELPGSDAPGEESFSGESAAEYAAISGKFVEKERSPKKKKLSKMVPK